MSLGKRLKKLREKAKLTHYQLGSVAGSDPGYLRRLENGERRRVRRDTVLRLSQALLDASDEITLKDIDRLLKATGYGPLPRNRIRIVELRR